MARGAVDDECVALLRNGSVGRVAVVVDAADFRERFDPGPAAEGPWAFHPRAYL